MNRLVLLATGWGPQFGGINSFNYDLARSLAILLAGRVRITCVVPAATRDEVEDATRASVELLPLTDGQTSGSLGPETAHEIVARLAATGSIPVSAWIGHDLITGPVALRMVELMGGQSLLIHHMSYIDYDAFKHGEGRIANDRRNDQRALFSRAEHTFGVGPLLRDRLADLLGRSSADTSMLVPGLADIEPLPSPVTFTAISFGRLDPSNDRIKQGRLAIAGFAAAVRATREQVGSPRFLRDARMTVLGIGVPGGEEERDLNVLAEEKADRVVRINALPYDDRRSAIFDHVRTSSVALMLSWHEGFGLTGWEAIAAEVPLIVSLDSGLYRLVDELLGPSGTACLKPVDIRGHFGGAGEENFRPEDEAAVRDALLDLASDLPKWKNAAKRLRTLLSEAPEGCTWAQTARTLAERLGLDAPDVIHPAPVAAAPVSPAASELQEILRLPGPRWQKDLGLSESQLLRPEEQCVRFHSSRNDLLESVLGWARAPETGMAAQLRTGPGGAGKTRLMLETCARLSAEGWNAGFLSRDAASGESALRRLFLGHDRTFVVVDYAETRGLQLVDMLKAALSVGGPRRVRIALLARDAGEWWERLQSDHSALRDVFDTRAVTGPYRVDAIPVEGQVRELVYTEALTDFADRLQRSAAGIAPPDLSLPLFGDVLFIHLAALTALLGERAETAAGLLDAMLRRERRYWHAAADAAGIPQPLWSGLDQAAALLTIVDGTKSAADARKTIAGSPRLRPLPAPLTDLPFQILRVFYRQGGGVDALRPDVLGERLITQELSKDDEILDIVLGPQADEDRAKAALIVLARLARRNTADATWLARALRRHLVHRVKTSLRVAVEAGDPVGELLAEALADASPEDQRMVVLRARPYMPGKTIALREFALKVAELWVVQSRGKAVQSVGKRLELIEGLTELARRQFDIGQPGKALSSYNEAKTLLSPLAARRTEHKANLAIIVGNEANCLRSLGRFEESLRSAQDALSAFRFLARSGGYPSRTSHSTSPQALRPQLAAALNSVANTLSDLGQYEQARALAEEALGICRDLAAARPDAFRAELAMSLSNLAGPLRDLGQYEQVRALAEEALGIYRNLAAARPDAFRADLATSLSNLASALRALGQYEQARELAEEAFGIRRDLAAARPDAFRRDLKTSLSNLANALRDLGQYEQARAFAEEALGICRDLAAARPDAFRGDLATSLSNLASALSDLGQYEQARALAEEALGIHRDLAAARPDAFRGDLATSLSNLAGHLRDLGQYEQARALAEEALGIRRDLAAARPDAVRSDLATSLSNLAGHLSDLGQYEQARVLAEEALGIYRDLAAARPDAFRGNLATSLSNLASHLRDLGQPEEARALAEEALGIRRDLAAARPDAFRGDLATSLSNMAYLMADGAEFEAALPRAAEALTLFGLEATRCAPAVREDLAFCHCAAARCYEGLGDAVAAREAATKGISALEEHLSPPRRLSRITTEVARHLLRIVGPDGKEASERIVASLSLSG